MWSVAAVFLCCCVVLGQAKDSARPQPKPDAQVADSKVTFGASLSGGTHGAYNTKVTLAYKFVTINIGGAYNPATGIFTAPVKGVYYFAFTGHNRSATAMGLSLMKNGVRMAIVFNYRNGNLGETSANSMAMALEKFDKVYMELWPGTWIHDNSNHHSTFSGFLLYPL